MTDDIESACARLEALGWCDEAGVMIATDLRTVIAAARRCNEAEFAYQACDTWRGDAVKQLAAERTLREQAEARTQEADESMDRLVKLLAEREAEKRKVEAELERWKARHAEWVTDHAGPGMGGTWQARCEQAEARAERLRNQLVLIEALTDIPPNKSREYLRLCLQDAFNHARAALGDSNG